MLISKLNEINEKFERRMKDYPQDSFYQIIGILAKDFELRATAACLNDDTPYHTLLFIEDTIEDVFSLYGFEQDNYSREKMVEMIDSILHDSYSLILKEALKQCQKKITVTSMPSKH